MLISENRQPRLQNGTVYGIIVSMSKHEKLLEKIRRNPKDWQIADIKTVADRYNISFHHHGTSHVTFRFPTGDKVTIPAHKPIKPIYIQQFTVLLDQLIKERATDE